MSEVFDRRSRKSTSATQVVEQREATICIVGQGYVGLPLAVEFDAEGFEVIGFDVSESKVETLNEGVDPTEDLGDETIDESSIQFTTEAHEITRADYVMVAVPTPVDDLKNPNLKYVESAAETIGEHITKGTTVILESTVYPGATREILAPTIEEASGYTVGEEFYVGYSPERMVPGDDEHGLRDVVKIVSGQNEEVLDEIAGLYESIVDAGVHRAPEIEVAEAAKCIENIQRDINIALVNELAIACHNLDLDTHDVLEAAGTKWNFHEYRPGLVGGHCIPVDPFFMIYEAERNGVSPQLIEQSREVNEYMPKHVAELTLHGLNDCGKVLRESTILVLGLTYKPGVGDIRTSAIDGTIEKLQSYGVDVVGYDPLADNDLMREEFGITVQEELSFEGMDGLLLATPHEQFQNISYREVASELAPDPLLVDVMGVLDKDAMDDGPYSYRRI